jgi:hypothetical protein
MIVSKISNCQKWSLIPKQQKSNRFEKVSFGNSSLVTADAGVLSSKIINQIKLPFDLNPKNNSYVYQSENQLGYVKKIEASNLFLAVIADNATCSDTNELDKRHIIMFTDKGKILVAINFNYDSNDPEIMEKRFRRTGDFDLDHTCGDVEILYLDVLLREIPWSRLVSSIALTGCSSDNSLILSKNLPAEFTSKEDDENAFPEDIGTFEKLPEKEAVKIIEAFAKGLNKNSDGTLRLF